MRVASYLGFFVMVGLGIMAFTWAESWGPRILLLALAAAVGWYALGLFARASTTAAYRAMRGIATDEDIDELGHLGDRARGDAFTRAANIHDPQRDRIFSDFLDTTGGREGARDLVVWHLTNSEIPVDEDEADELLEEWRVVGIVRNESLGEFLDEVMREHQT